MEFRGFSRWIFVYEIVEFLGNGINIVGINEIGNNDS